MKENQWVCFAVCAASVVCVGLLMLRSVLTNDQSTELAAWLQAFGSIAAVIGSAVVSFTISNRSHRLEKYRAAASVKALSEVLRNEAAKVREAMCDNYGKAWPKVALVYNKFLFESLLSSLEKVPVHDLPSKEIVASVVEMRQRWSNFVWALNRFNGGMYAADGYKELREYSEIQGKITEEGHQALSTRFVMQTKEQIDLAIKCSEKYESLLSRNSSDE